MSDSSLLADMLRGDPGRDLHQYAPPSAAFFRPDALLEGDFVYDVRRSRGTGKLFLGVVNGTMREDERRRPYVAGGQAVGWDDDRLPARDDPLLRQLLLIGGKRPIVLQRVNYDRHELFKGVAEDKRT